jgi:hypothetical protein
VTEADLLHVKELRDLSVNIRGKFLDSTTYVEGLLSECLANYFCPDPKRRKVLFSEVLSSGSFTFSAKLKVLKAILKRELRSFGNEHPTLTKDLSDTMELRNKLAHAHLDTSFETIAKKGRRDCVRFISYNGGETEALEISRRNLDAKLVQVSRAMMALNTLGRMLAAETAGPAGG